VTQVGLAPSDGQPQWPSAATADRRFSRVRVFAENRTALVGLAVVLALVVLAAGASVFAPHDPFELSPVDRLKPPSTEHLFGQDDYGRDTLSRVIYGTRIALVVGGVSVLTGAAVGSLFGLVAAYYGGRTETVVMRLVDVTLAFPDLITGLLVLAVLGPGLERMILAIAIVISPTFARLAHGATLSLKNQQYIEAARAIGVGDARMLRLHVLPNILGGLVVMASLWVANAIRIEASLSFIGLGVRPPTPTWGQMIHDGTINLTNAPWQSIAPGLAIVVAVLGFNLLGDGLRDALDPKLRR
jgi:peptide/nickel transport system permease protein